MDCRQTFVGSAAWDRDELISFGGRKVEVITRPNVVKLPFSGLYSGGGIASSSNCLVNRDDTFV